jgi:hypothetical protein
MTAHYVDNPDSSLVKHDKADLSTTVPATVQDQRNPGMFRSALHARFDPLHMAIITLLALFTVASTPTQMRATSICDSVTEIPQMECQALLAIYNSSNGANWSNNNGWLSTNTPCNWYGVYCSRGHIIVLNLSNNQLSGSIPPELGNITSLSDLVLYGNQLTGNIPPELGNLTSLTGLELSSNPLTGNIPRELGNLANLNYLGLLDDQLSGSIPPELGNLTSLTGLQLSINQLGGSIPPELGNLTSLRSLDLSINQLSGSIPPELGNLTSLISLELHTNQLTGNIPPELGNLVDLGILYLGQNQLSNAVPGSLTNLTALQAFTFDRNNLCEPTDAGFQTWLDNIVYVKSTDILCTWPTYFITGHVRNEKGNPISGGIILVNAQSWATIRGDGTYTVSALTADTYTLTPSKGDYSFIPTSRTVTAPPDMTEQDFTGSVKTYLPVVLRNR